MLNRVNIQYSIDLDDLPVEVDRIYEAAIKLHKELSIPQKSGDELLTSEALKEIDQVRKNLARLDHILNDVTGIINSYVSYQLSLMNNHAANPEGAEPVVENPPEMSH